MQTYISILRGINVSGQKKILMADLKRLYEDLNFKYVTTYIQSGNVIFKSNTKVPDLLLAEKIEKAIAQQYGFEVPVITRSTVEMREIIAANPFLTGKKVAVEKLHVTFLSEAPEKKYLEAVKSLNSAPDQFEIIGKMCFYTFPKIMAKQNCPINSLKTNSR